MELPATTSRTKRTYSGCVLRCMVFKRHRSSKIVLVYNTRSTGIPSCLVSLIDDNVPSEHDTVIVWLYSTLIKLACSREAFSVNCASVIAYASLGYGALKIFDNIFIEIIIIIMAEYRTRVFWPWWQFQRQRSDCLEFSTLHRRSNCFR